MVKPKIIQDPASVTTSGPTPNYVLRKQPAQPLKGKVIMVNPGHGCLFDNGTIDTGTWSKSGKKKIYEKDLNDDIAQNVKRKLEKLGATVIFVDNVKAKNGDIRDLENKYHPDMFIAIHHDAYSKKSSGETVYGWGEKSSKFRDTVNEFFKKDQTIKNLNSDKKYMTYVEEHSRELAVLKADPEIPAILVEVGYMSNPKELKTLVSQEYQDKAAQFIVEGVREYSRATKKTKAEPVKYPQWDLIHSVQKQMYNPFNVFEVGKDS